MHLGKRFLAAIFSVVVYSFHFFISSIENLQYKILTTLLTKYSTILQIQYHKEQDITSTPWFLEGKEKKKKSNKAKLHRTIVPCGLSYLVSQKQFNNVGGL